MSVLIAKLDIFVNSPCVPIMAMFHDKKFQDGHEEFFLAAKRAFPHIETKCVIVTDEELAITNAIRNNLPRIPAFLCWRHLMQAIDRWITAHQGKAIDKKIYKNDVMKLLKMSKREEFDAKLEQIRAEKLWDESFQTYFDNFVLSRIEHVGRWALDKHGFYNEKKDGGLTTNISEGTSVFISE